VRDGVLAEIMSGRHIRLHHDPGTDTAPLELAEMRSIFAQPITIAGAVIGGLYLCDRAGGEPFNDADEEIAGVVATVAAAIVRRTRLRQAAEQRLQWLTESAALTRALLSGEHDNLLRLVVERVRDSAQCDLVAVLAEQADGRSHEVIQAAGPRAAALAGRVVSAGVGAAARGVPDPAPRLVSELSSGGRQTELGDLVGAESAILAPLTGGGVEHGLLAMYRRAERPAFTEAEAAAATMFAAQMSLALELAEQRAIRERGALLDERGRIARDLHDHVIQRLFAIGLTMQSAAAQVGTQASAGLIECVEGIDEAITQIRSTIYRLTGPLVSAENSIRTRAARLVEDMTPVLGFRPDLEIQGPVDFGVEADLTDDCIAVLREALTNAAKHAHASRVTVSISVNSTELTLEVTDDGRGIGAVARRSGLANLRTRAERRSGRLIVASGPARGTRLTWTVPLGNGSSPIRSAG
jgi:signal transduction histidine kinase